MGAPFACGQFTLSTGSGTQDFTLGGETRTPVAARFQWSGATASATNTNHAIASFGSTDGTRQWYGSIFSETGVVVSDSYTLHNTDAVIVHLDGTGAIDGQFSFNSFIAGGVRLNIDNSPGAAYIGQIWFFFEGTYRADTFTTGSVIGTPTSVTTTGVAPPTFLILQEFGGQVFGSTVQNNASLSLGFAADNGGADLQAYGQWTDLDAKVTTEAIAVTNNAYGSGFINAGVECTVDYVFTASGFDATPRLQAQAHNVGYLAGDIPGLLAWAGHLTFPTSAGSQNITDPSMAASAGLICNTALTSEVLATGGATEGFGCGMFDSVAQFSMDVQTDDNRNAAINNTLTRCYVSATQFIDLHAPPTTTLLAATYTAPHASGITVNVTTNPAATRIMPALLWAPSSEFVAVDDVVEIVEDPRVVVFTHAFAVDDVVELVDDPEIVIFTHAFATDDVVELVDDPRVTIFTHAFSTDDIVEIVEDVRIALINQAMTTPRVQAARSGMEAGQSARPGMQRGQGGGSR